MKYAVGLGVRSENEEVWLDWFTETGLELAYVAEGYARYLVYLKIGTAITVTFWLSTVGESLRLSGCHLNRHWTICYPTRLTCNAKRTNETSYSRQQLSQQLYKHLLWIVREPGTWRDMVIVPIYIIARIKPSFNAYVRHLFQKTNLVIKFISSQSYGRLQKSPLATVHISIPVIGCWIPANTFIMN